MPTVEGLFGEEREEVRREGDPKGMFYDREWGLAAAPCLVGTYKLENQTVFKGPREAWYWELTENVNLLSTCLFPEVSAHPLCPWERICPQVRELFVLQFMVHVFQNQSPVLTLYFGVGGVSGAVIKWASGMKIT